MGYPNLDAFCFAPVAAGLWKQHEVFDGTYDFDDLMDAHELLAVRAINELRAKEAAERKMT